MGIDKGRLLVISGPSGVGKDTVVEELLIREPSFKRLVTYTSRPIREEEEHGVHYHFVTKEKFEEMLDEDHFIEHVTYGLHYKGTHKHSIREVLNNHKVIWRIDMSRAAKVKELLFKKFDEDQAKSIWKRTVVILLDVEDWMTLEERIRLRDRDFDEEDFSKRMVQDEKVKEENKFDNIVFNNQGEIKETVEEILKLILADF